MAGTLVRLLATFDTLATLVWGSALFFAPHVVGDFILQRQTDGVHWHLLRCVGGQILSSTHFFRFRNRSPETRTSCYLVRIMAWVLCLLITFNSRSEFPHLLQSDFVKVIIYFGFASIGVYILALLLTKWPIGDTLYTDTWFGNFLYQLDTLASIAIGTAWIACPKWLLHRQVKVVMDESHELCGRYMGILFVSSFFLSSHALHWRNKDDRSLAAEARAFCCFFILSAQLWSQYAYEKDWSGSHWVGISLFSIWTLVSFVYRTYLYFTLPAQNVKSKKN